MVATTMIAPPTSVACCTRSPKKSQPKRHAQTRFRYVTGCDTDMSAAANDFAMPYWPARTRAAVSTALAQSCVVAGCQCTIASGTLHTATTSDCHITIVNGLSTLVSCFVRR
jgi:hypothetical protein